MKPMFVNPDMTVMTLENNPVQSSPVDNYNVIWNNPEAGTDTETEIIKDHGSTGFNIGGGTN